MTREIKALIHFEQLEPRILLSGDGLLNIASNLYQDTVHENLSSVVQEAGLLHINEEVEEQIGQELVLFDTPETNSCRPIFTLSIDDETTNNGSINSDLNVDNISLAQTGEMAILSNDSDVNKEDKVGTTEENGQPIYVNDNEISIEESTSIEIRGPPVTQSVILSGMHLVDPSVDYFCGQIIYLNFDGAQDLTYNGPEVISELDMPAYSVPEYLGVTREDVIAGVLDKLESLFFVDSGVLFTLKQPIEEHYSTVYIGGNNNAFSHLGDFYGVAEQVDIGNENASDKAFVFPDAIPGIAADVDQYVTCLAKLIAHETGRLLGFAEADELVERGKPQIMADVNLSFVEVQVDGVRSTSTSDDFYPDQGDTIWIYAKFTHIYSGNGGINITLDYLDDSTAWWKGMSWDGDGSFEYYHETEAPPNDKVGHKDGYQVTAYDPMVEGYEADWVEGTRTLGFWVYLGSETSFNLLTRAWVSGNFVPSSSSNMDQQGYSTYKWNIYPQAPKPDIRGWDCSAPASAYWGQTISVQGQLYNQDAGNTSGGFYQYFYLSADQNWGDSDDYYLGPYWHGSIPGNSFGSNFNVNLTLPNEPPHSEYLTRGTYYIGMKTDVNNNIAESDETNNGPGDYGQTYDWDTITLGSKGNV